MNWWLHSFFSIPSCCRSFNLVADDWIVPEEYPRSTLAPSSELWSDPSGERLGVWPQFRRNFTLGFLLDLFKREAAKTSTTQLGRMMMSYLEYSQQEYVIHVIYGHGAQTISLQFLFSRIRPVRIMKPFGHNQSIMCMPAQFFWQEQLRNSGRKNVHKFLHDRCVHRKS
jgi:hypothetical protein